MAECNSSDEDEKTCSFKSCFLKSAKPGQGKNTTANQTKGVRAGKKPTSKKRSKPYQGRMLEQNTVRLTKKFKMNLLFVFIKYKRESYGTWWYP